MCVLEQAYQAAWHKKPRVAAPCATRVPLRSSRTIRRYRFFPPRAARSGPWCALRSAKCFRLAAKIRLATTSVHNFRQRYGYVNTHIAEQLRQQPQEAHRKSKLRMRATAADAAAICSAVKKLARAMFRPLNKKASLNQSMNSSVTRHHFLLTGQEDFQQHFRIQREQTISMSPMPKTMPKASPRNWRARAKFLAPKLALTRGDRESLMA